MLKQNEIEDSIKAIGFSLVKFLPIPKSEEWDEISSWNSLLITTASVPPLKNIPEDVLDCSSYYLGNEKHQNKVKFVENELSKWGICTEHVTYLPIKKLVAATGIAKYGQQHLLHFKKQGTFVRISLFLTNFVVENIGKDLYNRSELPCSSCMKCVGQCPTDAITKEGEFIREKCLRHHMLSGEIVPREYRTLMQKSLVGCEICQRVCQSNVDAVLEGTEPSKQYNALFNIEDILKDAQTSLKARMQKMKIEIGANYARSLRVLSATVIATGNSKDDKYLPYLFQTAKHPSEVIAVHSVWAIATIGTHKAWEYLNILTEIVSEEVKKEINYLRSNSDGIFG